MITLNASGGSVTFTFSGNSTYLNDGQITVPVNSLALIIDESDMITFRKSASNDIFVSANIAEFGMTKAELESWYKANMVGSTGGGGGGVTSGEVQTMIDESISGKVDADFDNSLGINNNDELAVYAEGKASTIEFNTKLSGKFKEYTFPSVYINGNDNNHKVQNVTINLNQSFSGTVSPTKAIGVKYYANNDDGLKECWWDYSNGAFTINSDYSANNSVRLVYNSSEYKINLYRNGTNLKTIVTIMVGGDYYIAGSGSGSAADCYISSISLSTVVKEIQDVLEEKQGQLTAGDGIKLDYSGNISANIKVTGDTYTANLNSESATTYLELDGIKSVDMWLNQSYTGTPSGWYTIGVQNLNYSYDYYLYENDAFTLVFGYAGSTLNYDSSTGKVSITCPSGIAALQNGSKFAPKDDLTNADCFIGLVSYTSNEYTIQDMIDTLEDELDGKADSSAVTQEITAAVSGKANSSDVYLKSETSGATEIATALSGKQDTLSAGTNITIVDNVISATGGGISSAECQTMINNSISGKADTSSLATVATSGSYDDLTNKPTIPTVPTNVSAFNNDAGYITANDITGKTDVTAFTAHTADTSIHHTSTSAVTSGSTDVVTSGGVYAKMGGMTIVKITESDYQSLSVKDPDTLYVVIPDPTNP